MKAILAHSVFIITYGFIAAEEFNRVAIALVGAVAIVIFGAPTLMQHFLVTKPELTGI